MRARISGQEYQFSSHAGWLNCWPSERALERWPF